MVLQLSIFATICPLSSIKLLFIHLSFRHTDKHTHTVIFHSLISTGTRNGRQRDSKLVFSHLRESKKESISQPRREGYSLESCKSRIVKLRRLISYGHSSPPHPLPGKSQSGLWLQYVSYSHEMRWTRRWVWRTKGWGFCFLFSLGGMKERGWLMLL